MNQDERPNQFLLEEYQSAQQLTFHVDDLRAKLTQFFLVIAGLSIAGLTVLLKGEAATDSLFDPVAAVTVLIALTAISGTLFVAIIARLRRTQLEHFRIVNNIRTHFLGTDSPLRNVIELSEATLPKFSRMSGSYFWVLLIIIAASSLHALVIYLFAVKVSELPGEVFWTIFAVGVLVFMIFLHDLLYKRLSVPPNPPSNSEPTASTLGSG